MEGNEDGIFIGSIDADKILPGNITAGKVTFHMDPQMTAKLLVAQYFNRKAEKTDEALLTTDDVYVVWFCYILGGWKALISTTVIDGMYYEVTFDKNKDVLYLDAYKKWENLEVRRGETLHDLGGMKVPPLP